MSLIGGIFFMLLTLIWILQIVLYIIIKNGKSLFGFLNMPLVILSDKSLSFLFIIIFVIMDFYLLITTVKGNFKLGLRIIILG